jgi:hypothetical protein
MAVLNKIKDFFKKSHVYLFNENYKDWTKRRYKFHLILGEVQDGKFPWYNNVWNEIYEPLFNQILSHSPECKNTGVRVLEYKKANNDFDYYKELKLGRLRWDRKSHQKWTMEAESEIKFNNFESWTPIWTICDKTDSAPDIFISIQNQEGYTRRFNIQFNTFIVIAVAEDLSVDCNSTIIELSKKINSKITICHTRQWSEGKKDKDKNWKFYNWIQDTSTNGIYKEQSLHSFNFNELVFEPYWEIVYKK